MNYITVYSTKMKNTILDSREKYKLNLSMRKRFRSFILGKENDFLLSIFPEIYLT